LQNIFVGFVTSNQFEIFSGFSLAYQQPHFFDVDSLSDPVIYLTVMLLSNISPILGNLVFPNNVRYLLFKYPIQNFVLMIDVNLILCSLPVIQLLYKGTPRNVGIAGKLCFFSSDYLFRLPSLTFYDTFQLI
jgi:hypothetical protein